MKWNYSLVFLLCAVVFAGCSDDEDRPTDGQIEENLFLVNGEEIVVGFAYDYGASEDSPRELDLEIFGLESNTDEGLITSSNLYINTLIYSDDDVFFPGEYTIVEDEFEIDDFTAMAVYVLDYEEGVPAQQVQIVSGTITLGSQNGDSTVGISGTDENGNQFSGTFRGTLEPQSE